MSRVFQALASAFDPRQPAFAVIAAAVLAGVVIFLFAAGYVHRGVVAVDHTGNMVAADAGLTVSAIHISGNRYEAPGAVYRALGFEAGDSMFAANPQATRARLRTLPWIRDAEISRHYPDVVNIRVIEKTPFALWQSDTGLYAVDSDGHPITTVDAAQFRKLPLFLGDRPDSARDLVEAIAKHRAVSARVKAMQRIDGRRWNLLLDDGVVIKLPEEDWAKELAALERLIVDNGVLERDIGEIDLRSHDNYIFVLRHPAPRKNARGEPT